MLARRAFLLAAGAAATGRTAEKPIRTAIYGVGHAHAAEDLAELLVGLRRAVLGEIAGGENGVRRRLARQRRIERQLQGLARTPAFQLAVRRRTQVTVGNLEQTQRLIRAHARYPVRIWQSR